MMAKTSQISIFCLGIFGCLAACEGLVPGVTSPLPSSYAAFYKYGYETGVEFRKGNYIQGAVNLAAVAIAGFGAFFIGAIDGLLGKPMNCCGSQFLAFLNGLGEFEPAFKDACIRGYSAGKDVHDGRPVEGFSNGTIVGTYGTAAFPIGLLDGLLGRPYNGNIGSVFDIPNLSDLGSSLPNEQKCS